MILFSTILPCLIFAGWNQHTTGRPRVCIEPHVVVKGMYHQQSSLQLTKAETRLMTEDYEIILLHVGLV